MRFLNLLIAPCLLCAVLAVSGQSYQSETDYRAAYERWHAAVDAHPEIGVSLTWYSDEYGPADIRDAVRTLASFGPNFLSFLVEELRHDTDSRRHFRAVGLLKRVAGIDLLSGVRSPDIPGIRAQFLAEWDGGRYANAAVFLRATWKDPPLAVDGSLDPQSLRPLLRYGVFAVPFISEQLDQRDSTALFAAFLNVTHQMDRYTEFYASPTKSFSTRGLKVAAVRRWARENGTKLDRLQGLREQVAAIAAK